MATACSTAGLLLLCCAAESAAVSLQRIKRLYRKKDYGRAMEALAGELPSMSGRSRSEGLLLLARLETDVDRAVEACNRVMAEGRSLDAFRARIELAKIQYALGEYANAAANLASIPTGAPSGDKYEGIYFRALSFKQLGDPYAARREFERIDRGDYLYWSYMALAELDMQEGRIDEAIERYESIAGGHYNPIAGFKLGECYEIKGERERAIEVYRTLISRFPSSPEAPKAREKIQMMRFAASKASGREESEEEGDDGNGSLGKGPEGAVESAYRFTLQFGAFTERENAIRLAEGLRGADGRVRVERFDRNGKVWHRVRLGAFAGREEAEEASMRILRETGYPSTVVPR